MVNQMRWRYGDPSSVVAAADSASAIEIGDLLWLDGQLAKPAARYSPAGNPQQTRQGFAGKFLGVAMQQNPAGEGGPIRVATTGVFEFDCVSSTFELGDWVGVAIDEQSGRPLSQKVVKVTTAAEAIGRVAKRAPQATEKVLVDICSTVMKGGVAGTTA